MHIIIFITASHKKEAANIAQQLLKKRLAACVNIIDKIDSFFWWQGKIDYSKEVLLIVKSSKSKINKIIKLVKSIHHYEVPEIIALPIIAGEKKYLSWLDECISKSA